MRARLFAVIVATGLCLAAGAGSGEAQCRPDGDVEFVCGPVSPEDLVAVPETPWVIVAGMEDDGYLYATDSRNHRSTVLFPTSSFGSRPDPAFGDCGGPSRGGLPPARPTCGRGRVAGTPSTWCGTGRARPSRSSSSTPAGADRC